MAPSVNSTTVVAAFHAQAALLALRPYFEAVNAAPFLLHVQQHAVTVAAAGQSGTARCLLAFVAASVKFMAAVLSGAAKAAASSQEPPFDSQSSKSIQVLSIFKRPLDSASVSGVVTMRGCIHGR